MQALTAIRNFFSPITPARRAKADIAELERDLYEARTARAIARQTFENKGLRISQIEKQIEELKSEYLTDKKESKTVLFVNDDSSVRPETVRSIVESELRVSRGGFATGGLVPPTDTNMDKLWARRQS